MNAYDARYRDAVAKADALMAEEAVARMGREPAVRWQFVAALFLTLCLALAVQL